ncbi:helix-turn-helix transcriptional regulator [Candidatus Saccharibacteria bacterium]|nr:helix-turn-helix transcriptional regulator [Candidatus Saccharibacteria bacterium]
MPRKQSTLDPQSLFAALSRTNDVQMAKRLGVSRETVNRWRHGKHRIRIDTANQIATSLNLHPMNIWGDEYLINLL